MKNSIFCTVFTPAYNRKDLMLRLYRSLCNQEVKNFEWVIVDDGSTDGTDKVFSDIIGDGFDIIYQKVENGGKHRAINRGLDLARGEVFAIVDSDDHLCENATKIIEEHFRQIRLSDKKFAGVAVQKCYSPSDAVGTTFDGEYVDATSLQRPRYNITGDKFEIFYTDVLRNNKFPEIEGEKFLTEAVVWNRIAAQDYLIRWFNDKLYICEYLEGGLTDTREKLFSKNPKGYLLYINELVEYGTLTFKQKMGHYSLYRKCRKNFETITQTANDLKTNPLLLWFAYLYRIFIDFVRKIRK